MIGHTVKKSGDSIAKQEEEGDRRTHGGSSRMKCGRQVSDTAGGRWKRQRKTELDGDELSVAYAPSGVTRHKSCKSSQ